MDSLWNLASEIDDFIYDFDPYGYGDGTEICDTREDNVRKTYYALTTEEGRNSIKAYLMDIATDCCDMRANNILMKII